MRYDRVRRFGLALTALFVAFACGGSTFEQAGSGATSGTSGSAGSASGGKGASGGTSGGSAGTASGGSAGIAGAGGSVMTGGAGGSSGSGSLGDCVPGDYCGLMPLNCCGYCGDVGLSSYTAIGSARETEWIQAFCTPAPPCLACVTYDNANYKAVCRGGFCRAIDIRTDELSACSVDTDCRLRWGAACCEFCGGTDSSLIAVSTLVSFEQAVCGASVDCTSVLPCTIRPYPVYANATCVSGHCSVVFTR